jgi:hypothetical protein
MPIISHYYACHYFHITDYAFCHAITMLSLHIRFAVDAAIGLLFRHYYDIAITPCH